MTLRERIQAAVITSARWLLSLRRPSGRTNARLLRERGESLATLTIREAAATDIPALAALHVKTWNDTYAPLKKGPPVAVRQEQWRDAFAQQDRNWFCFVVARPSGELVGFVKGVRRDDHDYPGELNKLYLLREYQRLGLGRRLFDRVAQRFIDQGIRRMSAYVDPPNPSCWFFEALGGQWLRGPDGRINFSWYVWSDLRAIEVRCRSSSRTA